jgi:hypothetical protein
MRTTLVRLSMIAGLLSIVGADVHANDIDCQDVDPGGGFCFKTNTYTRNGSIWPVAARLQLAPANNVFLLQTSITDQTGNGSDSPGKVRGNDQWIWCGTGWQFLFNGRTETTTYFDWVSVSCQNGQQPSQAFGRYSFNL